MNKYLPYAVVVFPQAIFNYFMYVVTRPPFNVLEFLDIHAVQREDGMCYVGFTGSEGDYYELENRLTSASIPYNYYPNALDELVTFVRLINDGAEDTRKSTPYATLLAYKHMDVPNIRKHKVYMIELEHNWENQVELCLKQSILDLLEE